MSEHYKNGSQSMAQLIKKEITFRIFICIFLIIFFCAFLSLYDITNYFKSIKKEVSVEIAPLSNFIISQVLISNPNAINTALKEFNQKNKALHAEWKKNNVHKTDQNTMSISPLLTWTYYHKIREVEGEYFGYIIVYGSLLNNSEIVNLFLSRFFIILIFSIVLISLLIPISKKIPKKLLIGPINDMLAMIRSNNAKSENNEKSYPSEIKYLMKDIINLIEASERETRKTEVWKLSTQVAHDIRSPLTTLNMAVSDISSIPENRRLMIKSACKRINDIANNLLAISVNNVSEQINFLDDVISPELIYLVLENIVSEKNYEYYGRQFKVLLSDYENTYSCFSQINLAVFKRILSNLINNSIESVNSDGLVTIYINCNEKFVEITIEDNGCGIPKDVLPRITEEGFSFGKKSGAGCGLFHAKQYIEKMNGDLNIASEVGLGTTVSIKLLRAESPRWFCEILNISYESSIVILDDDPSIHDSWVEKFSQFPCVKITHFSTAADLVAQVNLNADLYLVDYELLTEKKNGLDVIDNLNLNHCAVLVTSCFEDAAVRRRCELMGVRIIPKTYVQFIPIHLSTNPIDNDVVVFIDDDELMRMTWLFAAEQAEKHVDVYAHPTEFITQMAKYNKDTIIYIDSELGDELSGQIFAKEIYDNGFKEIYLATGHPSDSFGDLPWLKSVVGKTPPF